MVLVGSLPIQNSVAQPPGRAMPSQSVLFLKSDKGPPFELAAEVPQQGWIELAENGSAQFRLAGFSGLYEPSLDFWLELTVTSVNRTGLNLSFALLVDVSGDGFTDASVSFESYTTVSNKTEHPKMDVDNISGAPGDMSNGTFCLLVNRTDQFEGNVRLHCGADANASMLVVPFDAPVVSASQNIPPVADAGPNIVRARTGVAVSFHGSAADADGTPVSYNWSFGDGANATGQNVTHMYLFPGNFSVRLVVRDDEGASANDSLWVRINYPPVIKYVPFTVSGNQVSLRADATDPDPEDVLTYRWDFGDGSNISSPSPVHIYTAAGNYTVTCTVFDSWGDNATASVNLSIENSPPVIGSVGAKSSARPGEKIYFDPSVYDPEHDNLTYNWDFGDGGTSTDPTPVHAYAKEGSYAVTLNISDGSLNSSSSLLISVANPAEEAGNSYAMGALACLAVIGMIAVIALVFAISRTKSGAGPQNPQDVYSTSSYRTPPPGMPDEAGLPAMTHQGHTMPGPSKPPPARAPPAGAPSGPCPRCGSSDLTVFGDGHSKCNSCKKIIYTG